MFKPFDYFSMERVQKTGSQTERIVEDYSKATDKTLLRHIKTAECAYDSYKKEFKATKLFLKYLNNREQRILFESYGMPSKLHANAKLYWIAKSDLNAKDGETKWKQLSVQDRQQATNENEKLTRDYEKNFFIFARQVPETRVKDFIEYIELKTSSPTQVSKIVETNPQAKEFRKKYGPMELFFEKQKNKNSELTHNKCRSDFCQLDDAKKLHYIKKTEEAFDKYDFSDDDKPILSNVLTIGEMKLLLDSYEMPHNPTVNPAGYYFQLHHRDFKEDHMRNVYNKYAKLTESEKAELVVEFHKATEEYKIKNSQFLERIPISRIPDIQYLKKGSSKVSEIKKKSNTDGAESNEEENSDHESAAVVVVAKPDLVKHDLLPDLEELNGFSQQMAEVDERVAKSHQVKSKLQTFIAENASYSENAFTCYVLDDLKSRSKMDATESGSYLKKIAHKWSKLDEAGRQEFEDSHKKVKKEFKKSVKKFLKENTELDLDINKVKENIKDLARTIKVKFEDETEEDLLICEKSLEQFLDESVSAIDVKIKKSGLKRKNDGALVNSPVKKSA